jgi:hypothetical protein
MGVSSVIPEFRFHAEKGRSVGELPISIIGVREGMHCFNGIDRYNRYNWNFLRSYLAEVDGTTNC